MKFLGFITVTVISMGVSFSGCKKNVLPSGQSPLESSCLQDKMCGMSLVAPKDPFQTNPMEPLCNIGVQWVACLPYAFFHKNKPTVHTTQGGWWGESVEGICQTISLAHDKGINIMLKPQLWNWEQWVGDLNFETEAAWDTFERSYTDFIMKWVNVADSMDVELLCIGTELRHATKKRPQYWRKLIDSIRTIYDGSLTYAPNWDDYHHVTFWDKLDYIGTDAYFPLVDDKTPKVCDLKTAWQPIVKKLEAFSKKWNKPILFTEFGYLSLDGCAYNTWELEKNRTAVDINEQAQANAVQALLETFKEKDWWAGGFQWKWYPNASSSLGEGDAERDYTPQNKKTEDILRTFYK